MISENKLIIAVILIVVISMVPAPAQAQVSPTLSISPEEGPPGTEVTLTGTGFTPSGTVEIIWNTWEGNEVSGRGVNQVNYSIANITADSSGDFSYDFTTLLDTGGLPHKIWAYEAGIEVAETEFLIKRVMEISPSAGPAGTMIKFEVWGGGSTQYDNIVSVTYDNQFMGYACAFDQQGHASFWFPASGSPGEHIIGIHPSPWSGPKGYLPWHLPEPYKHPMLTPEFPHTFESRWFTFEITESEESDTRNYLGHGRDVLELPGHANSLAIVEADPVLSGGSAQEIAVGNGAQGIVGGDLPIALDNFPADTEVELFWNSWDWWWSIGGQRNELFTWGDNWEGYPFVNYCSSPSCPDFGIEQTLTTVTTDSSGGYSGTLTIPEDYGDSHTIQARINGVVQPASATFRVLPKVDLAISENGTWLDITATGLGWSKYQAVYEIMYDDALGGWISAITTRGSTSTSIPITGVPGVHTISISEGQLGWPFLNFHDSDWPWTPIFRYQFVIDPPDEPVDEETDSFEWSGATAAAITIPSILIALVGGILIGRVVVPPAGRNPDRLEARKDAETVVEQEEEAEKEDAEVDED